MIWEEKFCMPQQRKLHITQTKMDATSNTNIEHFYANNPISHYASYCHIIARGSELSRPSSREI